MYGLKKAGRVLNCVYEKDDVKIEYTLYESNSSRKLLYRMDEPPRVYFTLGSYYYVLEAKTSEDLEIVKSEFHLTPYQRYLTRTY